MRAFMDLMSTSVSTNIRNSQGSIPCTVQIFQGWVLHRWILMPVLAQYPGARAGEGGLRVVREGEL